MSTREKYDLILDVFETFKSNVYPSEARANDKDFVAEVNWMRTRYESMRFKIGFGNAAREARIAYMFKVLGDE